MTTPTPVISIPELEALAKAVPFADWEIESNDVPDLIHIVSYDFSDGRLGTKEDICHISDTGFERKYAEYIAAANPQTVLSMIADMRACAALAKLISDEGWWGNNNKSAALVKILDEHKQGADEALQSLRKWGL